MQIEKLHYRLELEWNKLSNNYRKYLTDLEKDEILNMSIFDYVEIFLYGHNPKDFSLGFEVTTQMLSMLDTLVVDYPEQPEVYPTKVAESTYMVDLATKLKYPYKAHITFTAFIENCELPFKVNVEQHGDKNKVLSSYHRRANKMWKQIPALLRNDKLYLHAGDMIPERVRATYIRKPAQICLGTYTDIPTQDNPSPDIKPKVECDLPEDYHDLLLRIAVQNMHRIYGNIAEKQLTDQKLIELTT